MNRTVVGITLAVALGWTMAASVSPMGAHAAASAQRSSASHLGKPAAQLDRARFLARAGAGFYAFDTYVLKPAKSGALSKGNKANMAKAAAALAFTYRQLKLAYNIANTSNVKSLKAIASGVDKLGVATNNVVQGIKSGKITKQTVESKINALNAKKQQVQKEAAAAGVQIKDIKTTVSGQS